jgi:hypothetical protein
LYQHLCHIIGCRLVAFISLFCTLLMLIWFPLIFLYCLSIDREQVGYTPVMYNQEREKINPSSPCLVSACRKCHVLFSLSILSPPLVVYHLIESKEKDKYVMKYTSTHGLLIYYFLTRTYYIIYIYIYMAC